MSFRLLPLFFVSLLSWSIPTALLAQESSPEEIVEPTTEQIRLNDQAVEALGEDNYDRAILFLEAAFEIGPINMLALNLGRAYQRIGKCEEAIDILEQVPSLPAIAAPPADLIDERAATYLAELADTCSDREEGQEMAAPTPQEQEMIRPGDQMPTAAAPEDNNPYALTGMITVGSGAALATAGLALHLVARSQRVQVVGSDSFDNGLNTTVTQRQAADLESRANAFDTAALASSLTGALLIGAGTYLFVNGASHADTPSVSFLWTDDFQGVSWSSSF